MTHDRGRTRVGYIGGTGRSGSTMLANVLGEIPGFVSVGEVRFLWQRGIVENRLCGCGDHVADCAFWNEVLDATLGPWSRRSRLVLATHLHRELERRTRLRTLPLHLLPDGRPNAPSGEGELDEVLDRLYAAIAAVAGAGVVVDSSKLPTYASLLGGLEGIDLRVAHFLRDPRAAAYSWRRRKLQSDLGPGAFMERRGVGKSAVLWAVWNRALELMCADTPGAYARVTYEHLLGDPENETRRLLDALNLEGDPSSVFAGPGLVRLSPNHTVAGNPTRHQHGLIPLMPDDEWESRMPCTDLNTVTVLTWPTRRRYGYRARI
jgi:hypothetical protein